MRVVKSSEAAQHLVRAVRELEEVQTDNPVVHSERGIRLEILQGLYCQVGQRDQEVQSWSVE
jgi:hypothetical protein